MLRWAWGICRGELVTFIILSLLVGIAIRRVIDPDLTASLLRVTVSVMLAASSVFRKRDIEWQERNNH